MMAKGKVNIEQKTQDKGEKRAAKKASLSPKILAPCELYGYKTVYLFEDGEWHFNRFKAEKREKKTGISFKEEKV